MHKTPDPGYDSESGYIVDVFSVDKWFEVHKGFTFWYCEQIEYMQGMRNGIVTKM